MCRAAREVNASRPILFAYEDDDTDDDDVDDDVDTDDDESTSGAATALVSGLTEKSKGVAS